MINLNWRKFYTKKRAIWGGIALAIILAGGFALAGGGKNGSKLETERVKKQDIERTVLATGQVVSNVDLNLSFQGSGVVRQVMAREGMKVSAGQTLAVLDQATMRASLTTARGSLAQAQANYDRVLAGASSEDVQVSKAAVAAAETSLRNAKDAYEQVEAQQKTLVTNAYQAYLSSGLEATAAPSNSSSGSVTISGTYKGSAEGEIRLTIELSKLEVRGLTTDDMILTRGIPLALGSSGLFATFSQTGTFVHGDRWTVLVPNIHSSTYLANKNAYEAARRTQSQTLAAAEANVRSAETALEQAKAALALKQAQARPQDVATARAQVLSAEGQVAAAQAALDNTILRAPSGGTITQVDIRVGEQASALQPVMTLQDVGRLHAEADVSETDIAAVAAGQEVDYTFDALGPDRHFKGEVRTINPASTVISGIVNYKVTATIEDAPEIKPGMTANMTILVARKEGAVVVPAKAIVNRGGRKHVRIVTDMQKGEFSETEVRTGLEADGGVVEILSGLSEGQEVVTAVRE